MPFQKEHITLEQRVGMVTMLLDHPGQCGLVSDLARAHALSRQSIYELLRRGREGLTASLRPRPPGAAAGAPRRSAAPRCVNSLLRPHLLVPRGADQGLLPEPSRLRPRRAPRQEPALI